MIAGACRHSVKLIEHLYQNWDSDVDLYSCNVPLVTDVENRKIFITHALQNYWTSGSSFEEIQPTEGDENPEDGEREIRESGGSVLTNENQSRSEHCHFKWAPKFADIQKSIDASAEGNDGWAISQRYTRSVSAWQTIRDVALVLTLLCVVSLPSRRITCMLPMLRWESSSCE